MNTIKADGISVGSICTEADRVAAIARASGPYQITYGRLAVLPSHPVASPRNPAGPPSSSSADTRGNGEPPRGVVDDQGPAKRKRLIRHADVGRRPVGRIHAVTESGP